MQELYLQEVTRVECYTSPVALEAIPVGLTNSELGYWTRWRNHALVLNRQTMRKKRNAILEKTGIDIFVPYCEGTGSDVQDVLSFRKLLEECCVTNKDHGSEVSIDHSQRPQTCAASILESANGEEL
jgi:hypothetical protein